MCESGPLNTRRLSRRHTAQVPRESASACSAEGAIVLRRLMVRKKIVSPSELAPDRSIHDQPESEVRCTVATMQPEC